MHSPYPPLAAAPYPHPLTPLDPGFTRLRNYVVMDSIHTGLEGRLWDFGKPAAYYRGRVRGSVGLIVTGGFASRHEGWLLSFGSSFTSALEVPTHRRLAQAVHAKNGKILLQILYARRYGYHPMAVSASLLKLPTSWFTPRELSERDTRKTIRTFVRCVWLAKTTAYDDVRVMGNEGYLFNQFLCPCTSHRDGQQGGPLEDRMHLVLEIVCDIRRIVGERFILCYRLSLPDLIEGDNTQGEVRRIALALEEAGITLLNTGIGWHESCVPIIVTSMPRAILVEASARLRHEPKVPVIASSRINTPEVVKSLLIAGEADLVPMARPLLAGPQFVAKVGTDRAEKINTCIACNQVCLGHAFANRHATCLVSPRAALEAELCYRKARAQERTAVTGAGPTGLSAACVAVERGHRVSLFGASGEIGGQFNLAKRIPGKEEFCETLRYFHVRLERLDIDLRLGHRVCQGELGSQFDDVVMVTGIQPRRSRIDGIGGPAVLSCVDVLRDVPVGARIAIVGAGGIGFDAVAFFIAAPNDGQPRALDEWLAE